jgi:hypothetical protein
MQPPTEHQINGYKLVGYPKWLASVRPLLETIREARRRLKWPIIELHATNSGTRPASDVLFSLVTRGDLLLYHETRELEAEAGGLDAALLPSSSATTRHTHIDRVGIRDV